MAPTATWKPVDAAEVILAGREILAFRLDGRIVVIQRNSGEMAGAGVHGFGVGIAVANDVQIGVEIVDAFLILRPERLDVDRPRARFREQRVEVPVEPLDGREVAGSAVGESQLVVEREQAPRLASLETPNFGQHERDGALVVAEARQQPMQELLVAAHHARVVFALAERDGLFHVRNCVVDAPRLFARVRPVKKGLAALGVGKGVGDRRVGGGVAFGGLGRVGLLLVQERDDVGGGVGGRRRVVRPAALAGEKAKTQAQRRDPEVTSRAEFRRHLRLTLLLPRPPTPTQRFRAGSGFAAGPAVCQPAASRRLRPARRHVGRRLESWRRSTDGFAGRRSSTCATRCSTTAWR